MSTCRDIEPLITASVDGEATDADRARVEEHLQACERCRQQSARESVVHRLLADRVERLHVGAPPGLRARCHAPAPRTSWFAAWRPLPAWGAVAVLALVFVGVFYMAGRGSTALAAELALDHVKCFALFEKVSGPDEPATIAGRLKTAYGWDVVVPPGSAALALHLVGGRRCFSTDGRVAHILYRHDGRPLSLFVVPNSARAAAQVAVIGHEAVIWSRHGTTYVVLAREPRDALTRVADYMRGVVP